MASDDCISFSNSTKAMSLRPGTSLTSLNPGNLAFGLYQLVNGCSEHINDMPASLTVGTAWSTSCLLSPLVGWSGRGCCSGGLFLTVLELCASPSSVELFG